jgi:cell division protein FtsQ
MPGPERNWRVQLADALRANARTLSGMLLLGLLAVLTAAGMRWMSDPVRFPLAVVEVKGEFRYLMKEQLQEAIAPHVHGGFFTVDVQAIRGAAEALPWVSEAAVQRVWPATLRIRIEEQQPVAHWRKTGFLNARGEAFFPEREASTVELPWLSGPPGQEDRVLKQYQKVRAALAQLGLELVHVTLDDRRAWQLQLANGVQLELGRAQPWQRLQRFVRAWPEVFAQRQPELQRVDLRYSNGFSVVWATPDDSGKKTQQDRAG